MQLTQGHGSVAVRQRRLGHQQYCILGPFGRIGAMLEGQPVVSGNTVTREIYVLDTASGGSANGVSLFVYTKSDVVSTSDDQVTVSLEQTIPLPLVGGSTATASMAAGEALLRARRDSTPVERTSPEAHSPG